MSYRLEHIAPGQDGDLAGCRALRTEVFVQEQGIAVGVELDDRDQDCTHVLIRDLHDQRVVATGRMLPEGRIGRMAVAPSRRGQGLGRAVLEALLASAAANGLKRVSLHAQRSAVDFYAAAGFVPCGEDFIEAGILHTPMERSVASSDATLTSTLDHLGDALEERADA